MSKRLRLIKIVVQPVFVVDDGDTLTEMSAQPVEISAADWPDFPARMEAERAQQEAALNETAQAERLADGVLPRQPRPEDAVMDSAA